MSETWVFKESGILIYGNQTFNISFTSNNTNFNSLGLIYGFDCSIKYDSEYVASGSKGKINEWENDAYRTVTFSTPPTDNLLAFLQANATKQQLPGLKNLSSYNQDLSVPRKKDLDTKQDAITGGASTITTSNLDTLRALISDANGKVSVSPVTSTELGYLDGVTSNVQTQLNNKVPTTRTVNNKALSSNITLTASDVDAIAAKDGTGTGTTSLEALRVTNDVEIGYNNEQGGGLYGYGIINIKSLAADDGTSVFTFHATGPNNTSNTMNIYSGHTQIELEDGNATRGLTIYAPQTQSGIAEDGVIINGLARITAEAAGTTYRNTPLTGAFYTDVIEPRSLPVVNTTNNLDMLMVRQGNWYTDHGSAGIQDASSLIVNKWPDNVTIVVRSFRRWGKLCLFTVQINVGTQISTNYGFTLLEMPYTSVDRVWINNQTQFYMDAGNVAVRVNNESLAAGNYTLTGFYLTPDNAKVV